MCIRNNSYARPFSKTLRQNRLRTSTSNLKRLTKSHMEETKTKLNQLNETYSKVVAVLDDLSIVCWVKFKKFCKGILDRTRKSTMQQHLESLHNDDQMMDFPANMRQHVHNLSTLDLTDRQIEALSSGLNFKVSPKRIDRIQ